MFGLRVFGVHLDAELFIHQQDEGDGPRVWLHVQQAGVFHHQPAEHTHTHTHTHTVVIFMVSVIIRISDLCAYVKFSRYPLIPVDCFLYILF